MNNASGFGFVTREDYCSNEGHVIGPFELLIGYFFH